MEHRFRPRREGYCTDGHWKRLAGDLERDGATYFSTKPLNVEERIDVPSLLRVNAAYLQ